MPISIFHCLAAHGKCGERSITSGEGKNSAKKDDALQVKNVATLSSGFVNPLKSWLYATLFNIKI
jgi:hypothetical protein